MKTCKKCGLTKHKQDFPRYRQTKKDKWKRRGTCKVCFSKVARKWEKDNLERARELNRRSKRKRRKDESFAMKEYSYHLKHKYGMTLEEEYSLVRDQKGICALCGTGLKWDYHIDHCHITGDVRGVLCPRCNKTLGKYEADNVKINCLSEQDIILYLRRTR